MKSYLNLRPVAMVLRHNGRSIYCEIRAEAEQRAERRTSNTIVSKVNHQRLNDAHRKYPQRYLQNDLLYI